MSTTATDLELRIKAATEGLASVKTLADEVDALGGDSKALRDEAARLNAELSLLGRQQAVIDNFQAAAAAAAAAEQQLADLRQKIEEAAQLEKTLATNADLSRAALATQRESVESLAADLQRAQQQVRDLAAQQSQLAVAAKAANEAQRALNAETRTAANELGSAERAQESNQAALARAQATLGALQKRYEDAHAAQRSLTDQVIAAENPTAALIERYQQATDKVSALERQLELARGKVADLTATLPQNAAATAAAQAKYESAANAARENAAQVEQLGQQLSGANAELSQAKVALSATNSALKSAESGARDLEKAVAADETALGKQSAALARLNPQLEEAEASIRQQAEALTQAGKAADYAGINTADLTAEQQRVTREMINARGAATQLAEEINSNATATRAVAAAYETLGIKSTSALQEAATSARSAYETIKASGTASAGQLQAAFEAVARAELELGNAAGNAQRDVSAAALRAEASTSDQRRAVERLNAEVQQTGEKAKAAELNFRAVLGTLAAFAGIQLGGQLVKDLIGLADAAKNIDAQLRIAAGSSEEFAKAQQDVLDIALQTGTKLSSTAELYGRLAQAIHATGGNSADAAIATRAISEAFAISGASAESAQAAIVQLAQGLASGTLRGDELNSVLEQAPRLAQAFADSLGITTGQLRALGTEGQLTPQLLLDAIKQQAPKIAEEFNTIPVTVGRAVTNLGTQLTVAIGHIDATTNSTTALGNAINDLGPKIEPTLKALGGAIEVAFGGIKSSFNLLQLALGELEAAFFDVFGDIAIAASKLTFGDISENFAKVGAALKGTSAEIEARMSQDLQDIRDSSDLVTQGAGLLASGFSGAGDAADKASPKIGAAGDAAQGAATKVAGAASVLDTLTAGAKTAEDALGKIFASINPDSPQTLIDAATALQQMGDIGKASAEVIDQQLGAAIKKLSDEDLAKLKATATDVLAGISTETVDGQARFAQMSDIIASLRTEQFARLGVDAGAVLTGIDSKAAALLQSFRNLVSDPQADPKLLTAAYQQLLQMLDSPQELESLKSSLQGVQIKGFDAAAALGAIEDKIKALPAAEQPAIDGITIATEGIKTLSAAMDVRIQKEKDAAAAAQTSAETTVGANEQVVTSYHDLLQGISGVTVDNQDSLNGFRTAANAAFASGKLSADEYRAAIELINSKQQELTESTKTYTNLWAATRAAASEFLGTISKTAQAAYEASQQMSSGTQLATGSIEEMQESIRTLDSWIVGNMRVNDEWWGSLAKVANEGFAVERSTLSQKIALEQWKETLDKAMSSADGASVDLGAIASQAERAMRNMNLLDDSDLSQLSAQIASARQQIQGLRDDADATLTSLKEELAQAQGDLVTAQQLRNEQRMADLQSQLAAAQATGDREAIATLQQAIATLRQINTIDLASAREQQQQAQQTTSTTTQAQATTTTSAPTKKVTVELVLNGKTVSGDFTESDADALLRMLQQAGLSST